MKHETPNDAFEILTAEVDLDGLTAAALVEVHDQAHALYHVTKGEVAAHLHARVVQAMVDQDLEHPPPPADPLDLGAAELFAIAEATVGKGTRLRGPGAIWSSPAGKQRIAHKIVRLFPSHKTYVEPFAGSGAVLFAKEPAEVEVLNDLDPEVAEAFRLVQGCTDEDMKRLKGCDWRSKRKTFDRLYKAKPTGRVERLHRFLYLTNFSYLNKRHDGFDPYSERMGHVSTIANRVEKHRGRLKGVKVHNGDYGAMIKRYDSPSTLFFLDPPYLGYGAVRINEKGFDEEAFAKLLQGIKGKFLVTYGIKGKLPGLLADAGFSVRRASESRENHLAHGGAKRRAYIIATNYDLARKGDADAGDEDPLADLGLDLAEWTPDDAIVIKATAPLASAPPERDRPYPYVLQEHFRGRGVHTDLRIVKQPGKTLVGWTLNTAIAGKVKEPIETLAEAKALERRGGYSKIDARSGEWKQPRIVAEPKGLIPAPWLDFEGVIKPGDPGATGDLPGVVNVVGEGGIEYGLQTPVFHEYFGASGPVKGRLIFRRLDLAKMIAALPEVLDEVTDTDDLVAKIQADAGVAAVIRKHAAAEDLDLRLVKALGERVGKVITAEALDNAGKMNPAGGRFQAPDEGGRGRQGGTAEGPGGACVCPACGYVDEHETGAPCADRICPRCGARMSRAEAKAKADDRARWIAMRPEDPRPAVLDKGAAMPPDGFSALPRAVRVQVPAELRFWKQTGAKARSTRDALVDALGKGEVEIEFDATIARKGAPRFVLQRETGARDLYHVRIDPGNGDGVVHFEFADDPTGEVAGRRLDEAGLVGYDTAGEIPTNHRLNVAKGDTVVEVLDEGPAALFDLTDDEVKVAFVGEVLKGGFAIARDGETWNSAPTDDVPEVNIAKAIEFTVISKAEERKLVTGIVLEPETVDAQGDVYSKQVIEDACHTFLAKYRLGSQMGLNHETFGQIGVTLVECGIQRGDTRINGRPVKDGSWIMTIRADDDRLWADIKAGRFTGFSIGGSARVVG